MRHQLFSDLSSQPLVEPASNVDFREFATFSGEVVAQFGAFLCYCGRFGIRLGMHRHVFSRGHGHGSGHQSGSAAHQQIGMRDMGGGNSQDQAGGGHNAVVRAQDGRTQPAGSSQTMPLVPDSLAPLSSAGARSKKEPEREPENRKNDDNDGPNPLSFGAGIALKNVH